MSVIHAAVFEKHPEEDVVVCFDFGPRLGSGEILTGTPSVDITSPSGDSDALTNGTPAINTGGVFTDKDGTTVAQNEGVTVEFSGGTAGNDYQVYCKSQNDSTNDQPVIECTVRVLRSDGRDV